jgi:putative membrane protein
MTLALTDLPALNAMLNSTSAVLLVAGLCFIKLRRTAAHGACMAGAFVVSLLFLISYLTYHHYHGTTRFAGPPTVRTIYLLILLTHTILAAAVVPMVLVTLYHIARRNKERHKRIARWTFPVWLYVSVTGVVIYLMLYQIYPAG